MSGIFGVFYRDGRFLEPALMHQMKETLLHRGPDGAAVWTAESVGLGHLMLHTTPESLQERQPLVAAAGELVLVADARIDNRDELIKKLRLRDTPPAQLSDSDLILAAYKKWGETCPEQLVGAFAFALWDASRRVFFCARDHMGIRPFYYYVTSELFVFASEIKALHRVPQVPRRLNELRVAVHLAQTVSDNALTFYRDIARLRPAHTLVVTPDQVQERPYWSLDPHREIHLPSDAAYAEAFREKFETAVRSRLRSAFPIGSMLSGGLDSSAVTGVARDLLVQTGAPRLHTISAHFDTVPEADESEYIDQILQQGNVTPHFVQMSPISPLVDLERLHWLGDEPIMSLTQYLSWGLNQMAQQRGLRVTLDGLDGDTAVSHGDGYLAELARAGRWQQFAQEAQAISRHPNLPAQGVLVRRYGLPYLQELARAGRWIALMRQANAAATHLHLPRRYLYWNHGLRVVVPDGWLQAARRLRGRSGETNTRQESVLRLDFAERVGLRDHLQDNAPLPRTEREEHYQALRSSLQPYAFELATRMGIAFAAETRHPFTDRRLIEFCLALPPTQKLSGGYGRLVLRRAMEGVLPDPIRWRGGKTVNSAAITQALLAHEHARMDQVLSGNLDFLEPYVNLPQLRQTYRRYLAQKGMADELAVWQVLTLALWLRQANLEI